MTTQISQMNQSFLPERRDGITFVAIYHFLVAGLFLLLTCIFSLPTLIFGAISYLEGPDALFPMLIAGILTTVMMALCLLYLSVGYDLWGCRRRGRVRAIVLALITLILFPIGTIFGTLTLWYLSKSDVAKSFN